MATPKGVYLVKNTCLHSCHLALIQGLALVLGGGPLLRGFTVYFNINIHYLLHFTLYSQITWILRQLLCCTHLPPTSLIFIVHCFLISSHVGISVYRCSCLFIVRSRSTKISIFSHQTFQSLRLLYHMTLFIVTEMCNKNSCTYL